MSVATWSLRLRPVCSFPAICVPMISPRRRSLAVWISVLPVQSVTDFLCDVQMTTARLAGLELAYLHLPGGIQTSPPPTPS